MTNRNRTAGILAALALAGALGMSMARGRRAVPDANDPQSAVYAMLEAARAGDVSRYLAHFGAPALDEFRQTIREHGEGAFSNYLRDVNTSMAGIAVADPEFTGETAKVRVEYVYKDHNMVQHLDMSKSRKGWQIVRTESEDAARMPVAFGTTVR